MAQQFIFTPTARVRVADLSKVLSALGIRLGFDRENPADAAIVEMYEATQEHWTDITPVAVQEQDLVEAV